jgi:DNA polymerase elongation subunit (family B)
MNNNNSLRGLSVSKSGLIVENNDIFIINNIEVEVANYNKNNIDLYLFCKQISLKKNFEEKEEEEGEEVYDNIESVCIPIKGINRKIYILCSDDSNYNDCKHELLININKHFNNNKKIINEIKLSEEFKKLEYCFENLEILNKNSINNYLILEIPYSIKLNEKILISNSKKLLYCFGINEDIIKRFMVERSLYSQTNNIIFKINKNQLKLKNINEKNTICSIEYEPIYYSEILVIKDFKFFKKISTKNLYINNVLIIRILPLINNNTNKQEISAIQCMIKNKDTLKYKFHLFIREISDTFGTLRVQYLDENFKKNGDIIKLTNERELLITFLNFLKDYDPDIVIGFKLYDNDISLIIKRCKYNNIHYRILGYLSRMKPINKFHSFNTIYLLRGRIFCDIWDFLCLKNNAKSHQNSQNLKTYDLWELNEILLNNDSEFLKIDKYKTRTYLYYINNNINDCYNLLKKECKIILKLENQFNILDVTRILSQFTGSLWSDCLLKGKSSIIEMLLLHEFNKNNLVPPNKNSINKSSRHIDGPVNGGYSGGLIYNSKIGYYDNVSYLLDVKSLYPSIVILMKLCFSTHNKFLYKIFKFFIDQRSLCKDDEIKSLVLKLTVNTIYGLLGMKTFRFSRLDLAKKITEKGRNILSQFILEAEKFNLNVIYGHTDSIMISINNKKNENNIINNLMNELHKFDPNINIKIDGIYNKCLIFKKTKYIALLKGTNELKYTGIRFLARNSCKLESEIGNIIIKKIFKYNIKFIEDNVEIIAEKITNIVLKLENKLIERNIDDFIISQKINKIFFNINNGGNNINSSVQPHISVALWLNNNGFNIKKNDIVEYLVCKGQGSKNAHIYSHPLLFYEKMNFLEIDYNYYSKNIRTVVKSICKPIPNLETLLFISK